MHKAFVLLILALIAVNGCGKQASPSPKPTSAPTVAASEPGAIDVSNYHEKVVKITALLESAPTSQPSPADTAELLEQASHDPDFRIRVRAMAVLPYIHDRERVIDVLIASLHDRSPEISGGGNVPLYATNYLAVMKAQRAIPDIEDWIRYLQTNPGYPEGMAELELIVSKRHLAELKAATTSPAK